MAQSLRNSSGFFMENLLDECIHWKAIEFLHNVEIFLSMSSRLLPLNGW
jgi:hypothetical protein